MKFLIVCLISAFSFASNQVEVQQEVGSSFECEAYFLTSDESGLNHGILTGAQFDFIINGQTHRGTGTFSNTNEMVMPGDNVTLEVKLLCTNCFNVGDNVEVHLNGGLVAIATITQLQ